MVDIDRSVKNYYQQAQLDDEQLQKLQTMEAEAGTPNHKHTFPRIWFSAAIAASLALAAALVFVISSGTQDIVERVAREVAMNHNKALAVEYQADSYTALSKQMDKLDFTLLAPRAELQQGLSLVGGRYCSIQGQLAAQIKLADPAGRVFTLYQTRAIGQLNTIPVDQMQLEQVDIRLWDEQGVLFALAEAVE